MGDHGLRHGTLLLDCDSGVRDWSIRDTDVVRESSVVRDSNIGPLLPEE